MKQLISIPNIEELTDEKTQKYKNCIAFWCEEKDLDNLELFPGDHVRIKTRGSGPYIGQLLVFFESYTLGYFVI